MKIVSFNVNGLRSRPHQLEALRDRHDPDIVGLQETKVDDTAFPRDMIETLGFTPEWFGQKGHYGVAILGKQAPSAVTKGFPGAAEDDQKRVITAVFPGPAAPLTVIDAYFPQGESRGHPIKFPAKRRFYADMLDYLRGHFSPGQPLVLMGDMNVAPLDRDIGIGAANAKRWLKTGKCAFLPEEREWLQALRDWGLIDAYRAVHPDAEDRFSWFDYRSRGFEKDPKHGLRIDLILVTSPLRERLLDAGIDYHIRALAKPSDHCPIWATFEQP